MFSNDPAVKNPEKVGSGEIIGQFVSLVRTKYEQEMLIKEIDTVLESLYLTNEKALEEALGAKVRADVASLIRELKSKEKNFQGSLKALRQVLLELKQIDISIAIEPTEELVNDVYNWIKTTLNQSLVVNFSKNNALIGGAQIAYKGKYFEFSLKKVLDQELKGASPVDQKVTTEVPSL